jgi:hypothetical protein
MHIKATGWNALTPESSLFELFRLQERLRTLDAIRSPAAIGFLAIVTSTFVKLDIDRPDSSRLF